MTAIAAEGAPVEAKQGGGKFSLLFKSLIQTNFAYGVDVNYATYDMMLGDVGAEKRTKGHQVKQIALSSKTSTKFKNFMVRRFSSRKADEILIINGVDNQAYLYLTSADGVLRRATFKKNGIPPVPIALKDAKVNFEREIAFWLKWEVGYKRRKAQQEKSRTQGN